MGVVLHDLAVAFRERTPVLRRTLLAYVLGAFRNELLKQMEHAAAERLGYDMGQAQLQTSEQWTVGALCSEASLRAAAGPLWEPWPLSPGVERLATMLEEGLSDHELLLLGMLANRARLSDIAKHLGGKRETVTVRAWRLRHRLKEAARSHLASFSADERADLRRFFRQTGFLVADEPRSTAQSPRTTERPSIDGRETDDA